MSDWHEDELIARAARFPSRDEILLGIGDDAALIQPSGKTLVWAVDTMVENTHFLRAMPADQIGWKLLAVNLSDLAAMNAKPVAALLSLGVPAGIDADWLNAFWDGLEQACRTYHVALAGGDTVRTTELHLSLSLLGESAQPVRRTGAQAGDLLVVTGSFGGSAAGLHCFQKQLDRPALLKRHWHPEPRFKESRNLSAHCQRLAMLDTSDGLARSLQLLCDSNGLGCDVYGEKIPVEPELTELTEFSEQLRHWVLNGGEDYELLAAVSPASLRDLDTDLFTVIGELTKGPQQLIHYPDQLIDLRLKTWGFQHF